EAAEGVPGGDAGVVDADEQHVGRVVGCLWRQVRLPVGGRVTRVKVDGPPECLRHVAPPAIAPRAACCPLSYLAASGSTIRRVQRRLVAAIAHDAKCGICAVDEWCRAPAARLALGTGG